MLLLVMVSSYCLRHFSNISKNGSGISFVLNLGGKFKDCCFYNIICNCDHNQT